MQKLVVFTGAGISAESGLSTFRDGDGLWEGFNVFEVAHPSGFSINPKMVLDFYNERRKDISRAMPNSAHLGLVELEKYFDVTVITQNIDDLHERAGSSKIIHLHGQIFQMRSVESKNKLYEIRGDINVGDVDEFGHQFRPHVVWFSEDVPEMKAAAKEAVKADIFVVVGTSLQVYPAATLLDYTSDLIPKFIIDKKAPCSVPLSNLTVIEKGASEGVRDLINQLKLGAK